ncbi:hypothetical protein LSUB1_G006578 [Lachnellula subtilissima]|uniref:Protein kinase domain-containing protein n=1 Tax=Lachnellula subtilissima TaxID=602034 RepID=A0A8H8RMS5_9HELO|nr:hypothetical protein LSUB1_G006578 [Lachnellula subtilissima]
MESTRDVEADLANTTHDPNAEHKLQNHEDPSSARTSQPLQNTEPTNTVDTALKTPDADMYSTSDKPEASNNPNQPCTQPPCAQPKQFNLSMFEIGELLGNGAYGTVHLARNEIRPRHAHTRSKRFPKKRSPGPRINGSPPNGSRSSGR